MEKNHQDVPWVPHADIAPEPCGPGVQRRILAYGRDAMCVENTFETGGVGAMHCHPHTQITYVVSGRFRFTIGDETREVGPGDTLLKHAGGLCITPASAGKKNKKENHKPMKIALINENSQAAKNGIIEAALKKVVEPMGHEVVNYGMYAADDAAQLTYVQCGILAAILLNSGAADYVITGCGTGEGAMLALNSFPGVICGHVEDPVDAYTFAHVNDGNAVAMPFAKGFGWGGELNLEYCFEKLFGFGHGQGYPKERVEPEQRNKKILDGVRAATFKPLIECLKSIDQDLLKGAVAGAKFSELFFASCKDEELAAYVKTLL